MRGITDTVRHLLIINGIFFFASNVYGEFFYDLMALHFFENPAFQYWQPITHMFMHGSFNHILFNMLGLWMFGSPLEQLWGSKKFLFYYFSTGLGAAALQLFVYSLSAYPVLEILNGAGFASQDILDTIALGDLNLKWLDHVSRDEVQSLYNSYVVSMVGASGALYGVLVAFAFLFPNIPLRVIFLPFLPIKAKYFVPILILSDLFFGFSSYSLGPVAHFAHVGGAVTGFAMMLYWKRNQFNQNRWN